MRTLRANGLSLFFLALFLLALAGHAVAGHAEFNDHAVQLSRLAGEPADKITLWEYVTSSDFGQAVMETGSPNGCSS